MVTLSIRTFNWILMITIVLFILSMVDCKTHRLKHHSSPHEHKNQHNNLEQTKNSPTLRKKRADITVHELGNSSIFSPTTIDNTIRFREIPQVNKDDSSLDDLSILFGGVNGSHSSGLTFNTLGAEVNAMKVKKSVELPSPKAAFFTNSAKLSQPHYRIKRDNHGSTKNSRLSSKYHNKRSNDKSHKYNKKHVKLVDYTPRVKRTNDHSHENTNKNAKVNNNDVDNKAVEVDNRPKRFADDNTVLKNRLEDIYPEAALDVDYELPLANLVRTKRFGMDERVLQASKDLGKIVANHENHNNLPRSAPSLQSIKDLAQNIITKVDLLQEAIKTGITSDRESSVHSAEMNDDKLLNQLASDNNSVSDLIDKSTTVGNNKDEEKVSKCKRKKLKVVKYRKKWARWTDWSSCSVTCGRGRQIRWRYCKRDCNTAEMEMEEKTCQLPACAPSKLFGIF